MKLVLTESQYSILLSEDYTNYSAIYEKYYKDKLSSDDFEKIVKADPTSTNDKMGSYTKWLIKLFINGNINAPKLKLVTKYLNSYITNLPDIRKVYGSVDTNKFNSLDDLYKIVKQYLEIPYGLTKLYDFLNRSGRHVTQHEFMEIVAADPTSTEESYGKYTTWLLKNTLNGNIKYEDLYKATEYLTIFENNIRDIQREGSFSPNINDYNSLDALYRTIFKWKDDGDSELNMDSQLIKKIKETEAEKFYEDDIWTVVIPKTERAACVYGKATQWCTAATESNNMFSNYNSQGPLYIMIRKSDGEKYQLHINSAQFMNENGGAENPSDFIPMALLRKIMAHENLSPSNLKFEDDKFYLYIEDYVDLADYFCKGQEDTAKYVLGGDNFGNGSYNWTDFEDGLYMIDDENLQTIREIVRHTNKIPLKKVRAMSNDELFEALDDEITDAGKMSSCEAQENADENEAWNKIVDAALDFMGAKGGTLAWVNVPDKSKESGKENMLRIPVNETSIIWSGLGFDVDSDNCAEFDEPYYGWNGDVTNEMYNEALENRLSDMLNSVKPEKKVKVVK